jgi:hypothetical protein
MHAPMSLQPPPLPETSHMTEPLKLLALDAEDLAILSAHCQDAVLRVGDMVYQPRERRFVAIANRFDWALASKASASEKADLVRHRAAIRIDQVLGAKLQGIDLSAKQQTLALLAIEFRAEGPEHPNGDVTLLFAGGAAIRLAVECVEAQLEDLGAAWAARAKPDHAADPT